MILAQKSSGRRVSLLLAMLLGGASAATGAALASAPERTGTVMRGMMTGGIWLELADNDQGQFELAILDGLPGGSPRPRFVTLTAQGEGADCALVNRQAGVRLSPCTPGGDAVNVTMGAAVGDVAFRDVSWAGSFAWGGAAASVADARARCLMPGLGKIPGLSGTPLGSVVNQVQGAVRQLPESTSDLAASIAELRAARLAAYADLALNPAEARANDALEAAIAGRGADGQPISLSEAARMRQDFERSVNNSPRRTQARQKLLTIDRQLAEIYDPVDGVRQTLLRGQIRDELVPALQEALIQTLASGQPADIADLLALESAAADIDGCAAAVNQRGMMKAREVVQASLTYRIDEVAGLLTSAVSAAADSTSARQALGVFETNPAIMRALTNAGKMGAITAARGRIAKMAADEERARLAGIRAAAAQAAADNIPPTSMAGNFSSDRVARSIVYIENPNANAAGSGFVVAPGVVLTNAHVVAGSRGEVVLVPDGTDPRKPANRYRGRVDRVYEIEDVAIVRFERMPGRVLAIAGSEPQRGSEIRAVGYPGTSDFHITDQNAIASFSRGVVTRIARGVTSFSRGRGETRIVQYDALTAPGSSGGPILDNCHRIVAIHAQGVPNSDLKEGISSTVLPELLRLAGVTPSISNGRCN